MKTEINEAYSNYLDICQALSQVPSMYGFGKFIVDSYGTDK